MKARDRKLWNAVAIRSALALFIGATLAFIVPRLFGPEFLARRDAHIYAPVFGDLYQTSARDGLAVVLIDDKSLESSGERWPPRYLYQARLLEELASYKPKAIFVDIYFAEERADPTIKKLSDALCEIHKQGIHLYLAAVQDDAGGFPLRSNLEDLAGSCYTKVAIQYSPDRLDHTAWTYPLTFRDGSDPGMSPPPSAALAIYNDIGPEPIRPGKSEMALSWGTRPAEHGLDWLERKDGVVTDKSYCRQSHGRHEWLLRLVAPALAPDQEKPICVFHNTVYAQSVTASTVEDDALLKKIVQGKIVMIGTALKTSSDLVLTPLQGRIPGVYLHAMALDNLLVYKNGYLRQSELLGDIGNPEERVLWYFLIGSLILVVIVPRAVHTFSQDTVQRLDEVKRKIRRRPQRTYVPASLRRRWQYRASHGWSRVLKRWRRVRRGWNKRFHAWPLKLQGLLRLLGLLAGAILKLLGALFVGSLMIWAAQRVFHIGLMPVADVIVFTAAAEWFHLSEKILDCFNKPAREAARRESHPALTHAATHVAPRPESKEGLQP
jgi:CHASE2 domain